ncbi:hypothetical protein BC567DRAFT_14796 [Phyllosticta citribraziliensis]
MLRRGIGREDPSTRASFNRTVHDFYCQASNPNQTAWVVNGEGHHSPANAAFAPVPCSLMPDPLSQRILQTKSTHSTAARAEIKASSMRRDLVVWRHDRMKGASKLLTLPSSCEVSMSRLG